MLENKDLIKKIRINLIYFIGFSLMIFIALLVYGHPHVPTLPFTIIFVAVFIADIFVSKFFAGTKYENAAYFNSQYTWKYKTIPFIIFCLIIMTIYWQETLQILSLILNVLKE